MEQIILTVVGIILVLVVVIISLILYVLWLGGKEMSRKTLEKYRMLPIEELKSRVFESSLRSSDYFKFIGAGDSLVIRFLQLVKNGDSKTIEVEWPKLNRRFLKLEHKAGHRGRPLILDYFCSYEEALKAYNERLD